MSEDDGLFHSKQFHDVIMNRYGTVMRQGEFVSDEVRQWVKGEAMAAGWHLVPGERDTGRIWVAPEQIE